MGNAFRLSDAVSLYHRGVVLNGELIMSYGAADQKVGISWVNLEELVNHIRQYDQEGKLLQRDTIQI